MHPMMWKKYWPNIVHFSRLLIIKLSLLIFYASFLVQIICFFAWLLSLWLSLFQLEVIEISYCKVGRVITILEKEQFDCATKIFLIFEIITTIFADCMCKIGWSCRRCILIQASYLVYNILEEKCQWCTLYTEVNVWWAQKREN